jgi:DNA repair protein RecO (recombination protein O)
MPHNERNIRVEALVLRHSDWGEADRFLSLYTREIGKQRAIAKGARKLRSRKAGHLEPFTRVALMLARGRDLWIVTQAETVDNYQPLREDLLLTGYAAYVIELLDRFTYEEGENRALFQLVTDTLDRLTRDDTFLVLRYYEIRLLDLLGFRPELSYCVNCQREIRAEDQFFSAQQGGALCPECGSHIPGSRPISMQALKYLRHFQRSAYADAARAQVPPSVRGEIETLMQYYLTFLLERGLNTPGFIKRVKSNE